MPAVDIDSLPALLSTTQLSILTGVRASHWRKVARGEEKPPFPIEAQRVGRVLKWPKADALRGLGIER